MSDPKFYELPQKVHGGVTVRVWFKTYNDAFNWMKGQGLLGENSAKDVVDTWADSERKAVEKEVRSLRSKISKWIGSLKA